MDTRPVTLSPSSASTHTQSSQPTITTTTPTTTPSTALKDIAFGSLAGLLGKIIEYPFDTIKVRLQSQPSRHPPLYSGPWDCLQQSLRAEGVRGLYRGVSAPFAGAAAETACLFFSYRVAQDVLLGVGMGAREGSGLGLGGLVVAGGMSGAVTSVVLTPIELVKCRMQVPLPSSTAVGAGELGSLLSRPLSPITVIRDVWTREGARGFWRGQMGTFLRETGGTAAWFGAYEASTLFFKTRLASRQDTTKIARIEVKDFTLPLSQQLLSGALAGMSYNFIFYPADTIKSKIQTGELRVAGGGRPSFMSVGRELWRSHGVRGLYRGCGITVARSAPSSALIFTVVEELNRRFG